jgi:hypothetical protein
MILRAVSVYVLLCLCWPVSGYSVAFAGELSWLRSEGKRIVDEHGKTVWLRGINLGGWLVEETWMMPFETVPPPGSGFPEITDHVKLWSVIERRFGQSKTQTIRSALRNAWLGEHDLERIRSTGLNAVRLPFLYDLLDEPDGFSWLDRVIDWAGQNGLYVILDMHGAPGRQSDADHTGEVGKDRFFKNPVLIKRAEKIWADIARRYKGRPEIAGYDLLNEPMGAKDSASLYKVQTRLYKAIRAVDTRHLIFIEDGYKGVNRMPRPSRMGWRNVVFSPHSYCFKARRAKDQLSCRKEFVSKILKKQRQSPVPFYIGEFNVEPHGRPSTLKRLIKIFERHGWSWSFWTYKVVMKEGTTSLWGWYRNPAPLKEPLDPFRDTADDLLRKIEQVKTERLVENPLLGTVLGQH